MATFLGNANTLNRGAGSQPLFGNSWDQTYNPGAVGGGGNVGYGQNQPGQNTGYSGGTQPVSNQGFGSNLGYDPNNTQGVGSSVNPGGGGPGRAPTGGGGLQGAANGFVPTNNPGTQGAFNGQIEAPSNGLYGATFTPGMAYQQAKQQYSIDQDVNYGTYQALGNAAQQAGLYGQNVLGDQNAAKAYAAQANQAAGPSTQQLSAQSYQNSALANLRDAATGTGPSMADIQGQQTVSQAMRAQLAAGASARGGAYQQAAAMQQAGQNAAGIQAQAVSQTEANRINEQFQAQQAYAQASGQAVSGANQGYIAQQQALAGATGSAQAEQGLGLNYYNQLAGLYNQQSTTAANLASNQVANDYGLSGTQLQTQTQQNIANQQQTQNYVGAGLAAVGTLASLASDKQGKESIAPQGDEGPRMRGMSVDDVHGELARLRGNKSNGNSGNGAPVADSFLSALSKSKATYAYKNDGDQPVSSPRPHGARYGGVMAQDLERVPEIGRQLVTDTPQGKKLELPSVTSAALMGLGRLAERVTALERRRAG